MWICPTCQSPLYLEGTVWACENAHRFDRAKEGYVNLLLAHHKRSKEPGDSKAMINARRAFLDAGHYAPLVTRIAELFDQHLPAQAAELFDAGCGEGYYLDQVANFLRLQGREMTFSGVDIAKVAMQKAAKRYKTHAFAVASTFNLPLPDKSQDGVMQVFAPASEDEICRVLNPGGIWIQVNPAKAHLQEIKDRVYKENTGYRDAEIGISGFQAIHRETLSFQFSLPDAHAREQLLMMTPFYWSASEALQSSLTEELHTLTAAFDIQVLKKDG